MNHLTELVAYGADGKPMAVRYSMLRAMLLNELQKQARENQLQAQQLRAMQERPAALEQAMEKNNAAGRLAAAKP